MSEIDELEQKLVFIEDKIARRKARLAQREARIMEHWQKRAERIKEQIAAIEAEHGPTDAPAD